MTTNINSLNFNHLKDKINPKNTKKSDAKELKMRRPINTDKGSAERQSNKHKKH